jgi:hypothetical protein
MLAARLILHGLQWVQHGGLVGARHFKFFVVAGALRAVRAAGDGAGILLSNRVATAVEAAVTLDEIGNLASKGLSQAVAV